MDKKLRVLHVAGPCAGGIKRHLEALAEHGRENGVEGCFAWLGLGRDPRALVRSMAEADVVNAHGYRALLLALVARWVAGLLGGADRVHPVVVTLHGFPRGPWAARLGGWAARRADRVIAVSPALARWAAAAGVEPRRMTIIPNGVDRPTAIYQQPPGERARFGVLARLSREKGVDTLLRAAARARPALTDLSILIAGDGPERTRLEALSRRLGLGDVVRFLGWVSDPAGFLRGIDVLVAPSRTEGQSLAVMEAMATGVSVIASRVGGLIDLVRDGQDGLLVSPDDPAALAAALVRLGNDGATRARMGAAAALASAGRDDCRVSVRRAAAVYKTLAEEARLARLVRPIGRAGGRGFSRWRWRRAWTVVAAGSLLLLLLRGSAYPPAAGRPAVAPVPAGRGIWVVAVDRAVLTDLRRPGLTTYPWLLDRASLGLMNTRTAAPLDSTGTMAEPGSSAAAYYTLGWGARAIGAEGAAFDSLVDENARLNHAVAVGLLGAALRGGGVATAAVAGVGRDGPSESAVGMVMDGRGAVDFRGGLAAFLDVLPGWRDSGRRYLVAVDSPAADEAVAADATLAAVLEAAGEDPVVVVVPTPAPRELERDNELTLVAILSSPSGNPGTTLVSPTTRRTGLVANVDLAPTLLQAFGVTTAQGLYGRGILAVDDGRGWLARADAWAMGQGRRQAERFWVVRSYIAAQVLAWAGALAGLWGPVAWRTRGKRRALTIALLTVALYPPVSLGLGSVRPLGAVADAAIGLLGAFLAAVFLWRVGGRSPRRVTGLAAAVSAGAVAVDVLAGSPLGSQAALGFSLISGARYYGLGNELMGALVGGGLIGLSFLVDEGSGRPRYGLTAAVAVAAVLIIGSPWLGANLGGALAAAAGFAWLGWPGEGGRGRAWKPVMVFAAVLITGLAAFAVDLARGPAVATHVGTLARNALATGPGEVVAVAARKVAMNLRLLRYTVWSRVLLGSMVALVALLFRPRGAVLRVLSGRPLLRRGLLSTCVAAAVALVANDSGVVAAGILMVYPGLGLLSLLLGEGTGEAARPGDTA